LIWKTEDYLMAHRENYTYMYDFRLDFNGHCWQFLNCPALSVDAFEPNIA
jgi:hypothetical protein